MPQIQYPAYTQPPAFTPPPVDQRGWRPCEPDVTQYASRGRQPAGRLMAALQTVGAVVFAIEQFALPKPLKAEAYVPTTPQQFILKVNLPSGKGSGYQGLYSPSLAYDFNPENWALPKPFAAQAELPDNPPHFSSPRSRLATGQWFTTDPKTPVASTTSLDWLPEIPDNIRPFSKSGLSIPNQDPWAFGAAPEVFPATLLWGTEIPDAPQQFIARRLTVAAIPAVFRGEAPESYPATLLWSGYAPDRTSRLSLKTALIPYRAALRELPDIATPGLLFSVCAPDTTSRASLSPARMPFFVDSEAIEQFAPVLRASVTAPDTTRRRSLPGALLPYLSRGEIVLQDPYLWRVIYPDTTARAKLHPAELPFGAFRGEAIEQFRPTLLWGVYAPDQTRRVSLGVFAMPFWVMDPTAFGSVHYFVSTALLTSTAGGNDLRITDEGDDTRTTDGGTLRTTT